MLQVLMTRYTCMFMNANKDMLAGNADANDSYPSADLSILDAV